MRIDYSEPKKSYVTPQGPSKPRRESNGLFTTILIVTGVLIFIAGFGTGWFLSQKSAKKSFQAATEQNSLENSPKKEPTTIAKPAQPAQPSPAQQPQTQQNPATPQQPSAAPGAAGAPPLSFYKTLPSGQKGNVLGSGINPKEEHTKQPLQAAMPANLNKPSAPDQTKPVADKSAAADKPAAKHTENSTFTVQVASFPLKSEAETQKNKLSAKGFHVFIVESNQGEKGTWYRVRVGKKLDQDAAKELAGKLGKTAIILPD